MKKICFITGTRADYGILAPVMREIEKNPDVRLQLIVTNMHLSPAFGMTVNEIEQDGFKIDARIESLVEGGDAAATVLSMAKVQEGLAVAFTELTPDLVVILGDRYEALAAASAAEVFNIPIAHLHGGETTEGAIDDKFRHAITKLSDYHFASTPQYVEKIISMGENPENVYHSGAPGAEASVDVFYEDKDTVQEFEEKTGIKDGEPFILMAMHPVTTLPDKGMSELESTLSSLETFISQGYKILVTMPNSDPGNEQISRSIEDWVARHSGRVIAVKSLGSKLFHLAMEYASAMIGNSSAALIEAPTHRLPAVNIGVRQKGRAHGITVLDAQTSRQSIIMALETALSLEMKAVIMGQPVVALNPYFKEGSADFIAKKLISIVYE